MSDLDLYHGLTRIKDAHPNIFPGSPMALVGVFAHVLQRRFSGENAVDLPYVWRRDPQQKPDATTSKDAPTNLYIASQYEKNALARDRLPSLLVEKGETRFEKYWVGHRADIDIPSMQEVFVALATVPIAVKCDSRERGESANLADIVAAFFLCTKDPLRAAFDLHDITTPTISSTMIERDSAAKIESATTIVSFAVTAKFIWRTRPMAPVLREIRAEMKFGEGDVFELSAIDLRALTEGP